LPGRESVKSFGLLSVSLLPDSIRCTPGHVFCTSLAMRPDCRVRVGNWTNLGFVDRVRLVFRGQSVWFIRVCLDCAMIAGV